jgi:hypothetical protein
MKYWIPGVCSAILGQLRGRAADIGRSLIGTENNNADLDEFMLRWRSLFISPAYQEKARATFLTRIQRPRESIIAYHSVLKVLWGKAEERKEIALKGVPTLIEPSQEIWNKYQLTSVPSINQMMNKQVGHLKIWNLNDHPVGTETRN